MPFYIILLLDLNTGSQRKSNKTKRPDLNILYYWESASSGQCLGEVYFVPGL